VEDLPEVLQTNAMAQMVAAAVGRPEVEDVPQPLEVALQAPERRIIEAALKRNGWNRQATAAELDINRTTLYKKMGKDGLEGGAGLRPEVGVTKSELGN